LIQKAGIDSAFGQGFILRNGERLEADAIVFCTGYQYLFPFFSESLINVTNGRVTPIYQHMVHIDYPTLFFIGLCFTIAPFPNFNAQILFALSLLKNPSKLLPKEEMRIWEAEDYRKRIEELKLPKRYAHYMGPMQWEYIRNLGHLGDFDPGLEPVIERLYDEVHRYRIKNLMTYKNEKFRLISATDFLHCED